MLNADILGFAAGILTSINIVPQLLKSIKTKKVDDISLPSFVIYDIGLTLWVVYGFLIASYPLVIMDGFACLTSLIMTYIKIKYNEK